MNSKDRFYACINHNSPDRPPLAPLHAQPDTLKKLYSHMDVSSYEAFQLKAGEDFRYVEPKYIGPQLRTFEDGSWEGIWGERSNYISFGVSSYAESVYLPYKDITSVDEISRLRFPSPDWYEYSDIKSDCEKHTAYAVYVGSMGHGDFLNGIAFARGVEQVLYDIATEDPVYLYIVEKRFTFFYEQLKRILEAAQGNVDIVRFGDDLGTQNGPIINPKIFLKLFGSKYERYFALAHKYGAKTMMHSCGSVRKFIPILIDLGLDILDVVQVDTVGMNIAELHSTYSGKIVFSGTISVQNLLRNGTPDDLYREIEFRKHLFSEGGIMIGPTNIMQVDMPPENFVAMCKAVGSFEEAL